MILHQELVLLKTGWNTISVINKFGDHEAPYLLWEFYWGERVYDTSTNKRRWNNYLEWQIVYQLNCEYKRDDPVPGGIQEAILVLLDFQLC